MSIRADDSSTTLDPIPDPSPCGEAGVSGALPPDNALETVVRQRWETVLRYLSAAMESKPDAIEPVHKLRVSSRRLAAALEVLAERIPRSLRKRLLRLTERIRKCCGKARDLDVRRQFLESLLPHASVEDAGVIELLCELTVERRNRAQKKLRRKLPRLERKLKRSGIALLDAIHQNKDATGFTLTRTAVRTLSSELGLLWSRAAVDIESPGTLHELRIACKHLRYASEVFMPALPDSFREDLYPQLERVQDLLGASHDAAQAIRALRRQQKKWQLRWERRRWDGEGIRSLPWSELQSGIDAVLLAYAQQVDQARTEFHDVWPGFAGASFRIPLEQMLAALASPPAGGGETA